MTKKWNLVVDVAECTNCKNCFLSAKDEHIGNTIPGYAAPQPLHGHNWIGILTRERGAYPVTDVAHVPVMCNHCDDAPCIAAGKGAVKKRDDGIVIIDPDAAKGRRDLVDACPYGAIWWNEDIELPQAWIFDAHLLDRGWPESRCTQGCPTGAMRALKVTDEEMADMVMEEGLQPLRPDLDTRPRLHYKNLHRYTSVFVVGEVLADKDGVIDCVAGARAVLVAGGREIAAGETDAFGEFRLDGLQRGTGPCEFSVSCDGHETMTIPVEIGDECVILGEIRLLSG